MERILYEDSEGGKNYLEEYEGLFLTEMTTERMGRPCGATVMKNTRSHGGVRYGGKIQKALSMMVDLHNHTRWKHKLWWHHRGCVWEKIASEWAWAAEWSDKRTRFQMWCTKEPL